ncbi:unnamed protein product [Adineta steineri]|uniref:Uncharacterized protein n=1 Tax=Adineta steineri TaxID=433720 RepID=A0A814S0C2_9BILA|nr:unnamed protein product [Adineta steineri]CAF1138811.1 unnamed protein product [Adineta steineri]CAF1405433.1 unnamed protein product [Adineta steineri]
MSTTDNWIKLYRWWQEHLKTRFSSPTVIDDHQYLLQRRPSLKNSQLIKIKKRSSYGEIDQRQLGNNDFRHVRDSIRGKNPLTTRITPIIITNKRSVHRK